MKLIKRYQQGGPMEAAPVEGAPVEGAPMPEEAGAPMEQSRAEEQLAQLAQQLVEMLLQQIGDPNAVMMILQMAMEMLQGAAQQQPVFKKGGKLVRKAKCGMKSK